MQISYDFLLPATISSPKMTRDKSELNRLKEAIYTGTSGKQQKDTVPDIKLNCHFKGKTIFFKRTSNTTLSCRTPIKSLIARFDHLRSDEIQN